MLTDRSIRRAIYQAGQDNEKIDYDKLKQELLAEDEALKKTIRRISGEKPKKDKD